MVANLGGCGATSRYFDDALRKKPSTLVAAVGILVFEQDVCLAGSAQELCTCSREQGNVVNPFGVADHGPEPKSSGRKQAMRKRCVFDPRTISFQFRCFDGDGTGWARPPDLGGRKW